MTADMLLELSNVFSAEAWIQDSNAEEDRLSAIACELAERALAEERKISPSKQTRGPEFLRLNASSVAYETETAAKHESV